MNAQAELSFDAPATAPMSAAGAPKRLPLRPSLVSILTDQTCGEACWHAKEEICRCSCGGENHGCLRVAGGEQPVRTCRIAGERYELAGVGWYRELMETAQRMNEAGGFSSIDARMPDYRYHYTWRETEDGAPGRLKPAPSATIENWPELRAFRDHPDFANRIRKPYLLWRKIDAPTLYFCPDQCERCDKQRAKFATV